MTATHVLHWPDSELAGLTADTPTTLRLRLAAAHCHRADDGLVGYLRPVELVFHAATWQGDGPALGGIAEGHLLCGGQPLGLVGQGLPLPLDCHGAVVCHLRLISGTVLQITAGRVVVQPGEDARFRESFAC
ncbi:hypothetical protein [Sphaerotilus sp.]|jgi:hypothetical protein|uniref:hypothetical protein n=1 Tax=Sphaerotilus sp. TaxID=2093942 RepID=UPI0025F2730A|nr:hypothetical protein [Sphaerotilus sp.]